MISALAGTAIVVSAFIMIFIIGSATMKPISPTKPEVESRHTSKETTPSSNSNR